MHCSIGKQLGVLLAQYEEALYRGGDDVETLQKLALISESYRNLVMAEKPGFEADFDVGYAAELESLLRDERPRPTAQQLLGDYLPPDTPNPD